MMSWWIDVTAWVASAGILSVVIGFAAETNDISKCPKCNIPTKSEARDPNCPHSR